MCQFLENIGVLGMNLLRVEEEVIWCHDLFDDSSYLLIEDIATSKPFLSIWPPQSMAGVTSGLFINANCGREHLLHWRFYNQCGDLSFNCKTVSQWTWVNWKVSSVFVSEANQRNIVLLLFECSLLIEVEFLEAFLPTAIYTVQFSIKCIMMCQ